MVRPTLNPTQHHHSRPLDDDSYCDDPTGEEAGNCCHGEGTKGTTLRSKHSETEQRRRSKINDRFQTLRDLIPQSDQKRDKASLLLEVIGYIQYLQEKLQMYEGSYHGHNRDPIELTPWGGISASPECHTDPSGTSQGGANQDDNDSTSQAVKDLPQLRDPVATSDSQTQSNMFPYVQHGVLASDPDVASDPRTQASRVPVTSQCPFPNNVENDPEQLNRLSDYSGFSSDLSQGILNNLTLALQSSGVDLRHASISVQLDVRRQGGL
ncbi:hypothetical protein MLD38_001529 [Melastoma candidum]|uniref:Uncharacterized protein n=1 Tax=Melastoma candidum TaxID=119954 RepID=A0ACB9SDZ6_9MYRT|nr:hypothetical protein MLD38_001529 [Melastoma candidum]